MKPYELLGVLGYIVVWIGYTFGPFFGLWAAFQHGAFWHGLASICVPYYGIVYWAVA